MGLPASALQLQDVLYEKKGPIAYYGLQGMRERAVRIGGKLRIISSVDSGTEVRLVIPGSIAYRAIGSTRIE